MTFTQLVVEVAQEAGLSREKVSAVLRAFIKVTRRAVMSGVSVRLFEFGSFYATKLKERKVFGGTRVAKGSVIRFRESRYGQVRRRDRRGEDQDLVDL